MDLIPLKVKNGLGSEPEPGDRAETLSNSDGEFNSGDLAENPKGFN